MDLFHDIIIHTDSKIHTEFLYASATGQLSTCYQLLVDKETNTVQFSPDICGSEGYTALHLACWAGHYPICHMLLQYQANVLAKTHHGFLPLHFATEQNHVDIVLLLLKYGAGTAIDEPTTWYGNTSLHNSVGSLQICRLVLDHGAQVDIQDVYGKTPFHDAIKKGNIAVCKLLLETWKSSTSTSKVHEIIQHQKRPEAYGGYTYLLEAVNARQVDIAHLLLEHGANPNDQDVLGQSALFLAIMKGDVSMVRLLIHYQANIWEIRSCHHCIINHILTDLQELDRGNIQMDDPTPILQPGQHSLLYYVLQNVAHPPQVPFPNANEYTHIHYIQLAQDFLYHIWKEQQYHGCFEPKELHEALISAIRMNQPTLVRLLTKLGALFFLLPLSKGHDEVMIMEMLQEQPYQFFHDAIYLGAIELVHAILEHSQGIWFLYQTNMYQQTPLHIACYYGNLSMVQCLLSFLDSTMVSKYILLSDHTGKNAIEIASTQEIIHFLVVCIMNSSPEKDQWVSIQTKFRQALTPIVPISS